jgi:lipoprotein-anchoring transpeptidase ErfK/SrfK
LFLGAVLGLIMRPGYRNFLPVILALAGLSSNIPAQAGQEPLVIPGIGPENMPPPAPAPQQRQAAGAGSYGGGFIDFVVTGYSGAGARYNVPPPARPDNYWGASVQPTYSATRIVSAAPEGEIREAPDARYQRQEVAYDGRERPGTIIIDTPNKFLFLIQPGGRALRYGIGVGRPGFEWSGVKTISRKAEWPGWTPPPEMLLRRPDLPDHMDGGPGNPLGARALYLGSSMYRIHGTNEPATIGQNVSSGCIRMMNEDVIDLYNRVPVGTKVIVI